ncbi:MAG: hypothetical protein LBU87_06520 [Lactobacillales bacterium]|jgi:phosphohistidine phosphatase SixA|nr:hypothetical protein [Lactobacillales bacterium]
MSQDNLKSVEREVGRYVDAGIIKQDRVTGSPTARTKESAKLLQRLEEAADNAGGSYRESIQRIRDRHQRK